MDNEAKFSLTSASSISNGLTFAFDAGPGAFLATIVATGIYQVTISSIVRLAAASTVDDIYVGIGISINLDTTLPSSNGTIATVVTPSVSPITGFTTFPLTYTKILSLTAGDTVTTLAYQDGDYVNTSFNSNKLVITKVG
jgi:hypothetical protein